ncbi:DUF4476 domain-containing protein [Flammeovirga aprica]|uniref:DUF4476 domain-containing protein n=1 Tax=Flammeovirga aprica JL-4 TaxID=694437 RepID=A0A7X9XD63_9BACT|nr:DUF4476 domain-containing protein [Flammeovirga aprica]NME72475.1 DUF4476 domain-containing protein [Flammeovirga aprica JL-4]
MKNLITILCFLFLSTIGFTQNIETTNCTPISNGHFTEVLTSFKVMSSSALLESSKIFVEKYCMDSEKLGGLSSCFQSDQDRIEFLYYAFSHTDHKSSLVDTDFHFEDEAYQEVFVSFLSNMHQDISEGLNTTEQEIVEYQKTIQLEDELEDYEVKVVYVPEYRGRIGHEKPMSSSDFFDVQRAIQLESISSQKVEVFINQVKDKGISVHQLNGILSLYNYENDKMKVFNSAIDKIYDLDNLSSVRTHFVNLFHKKEIDRITHYELDKYMTDQVKNDEHIEFHHY